MVATPPLDERLAGLALPGEAPRILLHCCCAPCSSYVLEYLSPFARITILFYNPNIIPCEEYDKRAAEIEKLLSGASLQNCVDILPVKYVPADFKTVAAPYWDEPEGGLRCRACFELRLGEAAKRAKEHGFKFFATTLSVSPHKDAALLGEIGAAMAEKHGVQFLHADFKKRGGYKRSVDLSKQYGLYRQSYCGCGISVDS